LLAATPVTGSLKLTSHWSWLAGPTLVVAAAAPSIQAVMPAAPDSLDAAIRRATSKRKEDRFDDVAAFYAELRRAAACPESKDAGQDESGRETQHRVHRGARFVPQPAVADQHVIGHSGRPERASVAERNTTR
jgi:hypothetical protein